MTLAQERVWSFPKALAKLRAPHADAPALPERPDPDLPLRAERAVAAERLLARRD